MKNCNLTVKFLMVVLWLLNGVVPISAQEMENEKLLEFSLADLLNVKIKAATKTEIPISKSPNAVTVITHERIRESGARSLPELLRLVAGVNVRWNPMMQTIDLRSFGQSPFTSRVLLLIDGIPYNSWNKGGFPQHPGFDFFVLQNVKQVEVIHGSGSALYGENAYWGVINIVTLSGEDIDGGQVEFYGGNRKTRSTSVTYGQRIGEGSILLSGKYLQSQLPIEFWFEENDAKINGSDIFLKGKYKGFELSYYLHDDDADGFSNPVGPPGFAFKSAEKIEQTVNIVALKYEFVPKDGKISFAGDVSRASRNGSYCGSCHAAPQDDGRFKGRASHGYQAIGDFRLGFLLPKNNLLLGTEVRRVDAGDHKDELLSQDEAPQGIRVTQKYNKFAVYLQDQISVIKDRVDVVAGFRYDSKTDPGLFGDRWSPRIAGVFNPTEKVTVRGGWSKAFHFPDFSSLYQNTWFFSAASGGATAFPPSLFKPNPGLKPEQISNFDFGLEYRFNPKLSAKLNLFRSKVEDFIVIAFDNGLRFENHPDNATIWGSELEFHWQASRKFRGFMNWAYQDQDQEGNLLDSSGKLFEFVYAPKHKMNIGGYFGPFAGFRATLETTWRDDYIIPSFWDAFTTGTPDGYTYLNVKLMYDLPFSSANVTRVSLYGRNLLDEQPQETFIGVNNRTAGREIFAEIAYNFGFK